MKKRLWAVLLTICLVAALLPTTTLAADPVLQGYCGGDANAENVNWKLVQNNEDSSNPTYTLIISGTGAMTDYSGKNRPTWYNSKESITKIVVVNGVTVIGDAAFSGCDNVTSVSLPEGLTSIGSYAFECSNNSTPKLTAITFPSTLTTVKEFAFLRSALTTVNLPNSVTTIQKGTFKLCTALTSITAEGVTTIGEQAFQGCSMLTTVQMAGITSLGANAFNSCSALTELPITEGITEIPNGAFASCTALTGIVVPNSVTSIGNKAFNGCTSLTSVTLPVSIEKLGSSNSAAFSNKATFILVGSGAVDAHPSDNTAWATGIWSINKAAIEKIIVSEGITSIGTNAFRGLGTLKYVELPSTVTHIGDYAFYNDTALIAVDMSKISSVSFDQNDVVQQEQSNCSIYVSSQDIATGISSKCTDRTKNNLFLGVVNGGTFPADMTFESGKLATPVKDGYIFDGWYADSSFSGTAVNAPTAGQTYYAKWSEIIAEVDGTGCTSLAAAVAMANDKTIKLLKDVTENVTIPADKTITLDLNGHTLVDFATVQDENAAESSRKHTITNNGTLTILDSVGTGVVDNVSHGRAALYNVGTIVEIKGGKFTRSVDNSTDATSAGGNSWYVVYNAENATINRISGGEFLAIGKFSSLFCNSGTIDEISGGTFTQDGFIAFKNQGTVKKISGGTFASKDESCIQNWGSIGEITGGTITAGSIGIWNFSSDTYNRVGEVGQISGGNISGSTAAIRLNDYDATYLSKPFSTNKASVAVSGGNISGDLQINANTELSVSGGNFSQPVKRKYLDLSLTAELKRASGETPYSYYTSVAAATAVAQPGDIVTDLNATGGQMVTVTLKYNDGATTADIIYNVANGMSITLPAPTRIGYTFNGWYDGSTKVSSPYEVTKDVTLTASWSYISSGSSSSDPTYSVSTPSKTENGSVTVSPKNASKGDRVTVTVKPDSGYEIGSVTVLDSKGNELKLTDKGDGKYTFTMPGGKVEVKATFVKAGETSPFVDVPADSYYFDAVKWAQKLGITNGKANGLFGSNDPCTRGQIVTFLWRAAGSPEPKGAASGMSDVVSGSYYEKAVAWAIENGITTGTTASTFSPDATCTRAQAVTFLARALNAKAASAAEFSDVPTDSYFADAVAWAAANGVTEGIGGSLFGSDNDCTRGQIVTFLYRAYNK